VLLSGLFGRAMKGLVVASELRTARKTLQEQYLAMSELSDTLEERVRRRTEELEAAHLDAIFILAAASEAKDENTAAHLRRIEGLAGSLAGVMGLPADEARVFSRAAILHDVGKLHVPDEILRKPGPLTAEERRIMQEHTLAGERILPDRPHFAAARRVTRSHHENWDGSGYPDGIAREAIPLEARIVHVVDVYDALTSVRPYKGAWTSAQAAGFIRQQKGVMFDPDLVEAFIRERERRENTV
jgi:response regulator RpfG family c-di-GMP phosphodiesterase